MTRIEEIEEWIKEILPYVEDRGGGWSLWTEENVADIHYLLDQVHDLKAALLGIANSEETDLFIYAEFAQTTARDAVAESEVGG